MEITTFKDLVLWVVRLINQLIPVVAALALLVFFWGLAKFLTKTDDPKNNADGRNLMIWGAVALAVMVSYMGLIGIAQSALGLQQTSGLPFIKSTQPQ